MTNELRLSAAVLAALAGLVCAGLLSALLTRPIALAVRQVADAARGLATGNLDQTITVNTQDELGEMAEEGGDVGNTESNA